MKEIPVQWIRDSIDILLLSAEKLPEGIFRDAIMLRADHYMDLIDSWVDSLRVKL